MGKTLVNHFKFAKVFFPPPPFYAIRYPYIDDYNENRHGHVQHTHTHTHTHTHFLPPLPQPSWSSGTWSWESYDCTSRKNSCPYCPLWLSCCTRQRDRPKGKGSEWQTNICKDHCTRVIQIPFFLPGRACSPCEWTSPCPCRRSSPASPSGPNPFPWSEIVLRKLTRNLARGSVPKT